MFIHLPVLLLLALEGQPLPGPVPQEALGPACPQISKLSCGLTGSATSFVVFVVVCFAS